MDINITGNHSAIDFTTLYLKSSNEDDSKNIDSLYAQPISAQEMEDIDRELRQNSVLFGSNGWIKRYNIFPFANDRSKHFSIYDCYDNHNGKNTSFLVINNINFCCKISNNDGVYSNPIHSVAFKNYYVKFWIPKLLLCMRSMMDPKLPTCNNTCETRNRINVHNEPLLRHAKRVDHTAKTVQFRNFIRIWKFK